MSEASKYAAVMEQVATDPDYKDDFLADPKGVLEAAGFSFPSSVTTVEVVYDTATTIHAVLPFHSGEGDNFAC